MFNFCNYDLFHWFEYIYITCLNTGTPKADTAQKESISDDNNEIFSQLIQTAKQYTEKGKIKDALELYREALQINPGHDKLAKRIAKIEVFISLSFLLTFVM